MHLQTNSGILDDEQLVLMIREGNVRAVSILVKRHSVYVARIASRFLLSEEDVQDVVQDTFIRVWKHIRDFNAGTRFTTWIYSIAFNLCLDRIRVKRRFQTVFSRSADPEISDESSAMEDPQTRLDSEAIGKAIREFAGGLAETQRTVFILRDLQDLPVEEVCRITGFDDVKVKTNLYHARKYIREKLTKGGYL